MSDAKLKLFLISQNANNAYDTYDSAVVCAPDEATARLMDPGSKDGAFADFSRSYSDWCWSAEEVTVKLIGDAAPGMSVGAVCASFNAG